MFRVMAERFGELSSAEGVKFRTQWGGRKSLEKKNKCMNAHSRH